jgi:alanine racemase
MLVLGFTLPPRMQDAQAGGISITISSLAQLEALHKLKHKGEPLRVHIKVDTGMHRQGFQLEEQGALFALLARFSKKILLVEGLAVRSPSSRNGSRFFMRQDSRRFAMLQQRAERFFIQVRTLIWCVLVSVATDCGPPRKQNSIFPGQ